MKVTKKHIGRRVRLRHRLGSSWGRDYVGTILEVGVFPQFDDGPGAVLSHDDPSDPGRQGLFCLRTWSIAEVLP